MKKYPTKIKLILHFLEGSKRFFALSMLFAVLASLLDMVNPRIISFVVDSVIGDKASSLPAAVNRLIERFGGIPALREHPFLIAFGDLDDGGFGGLDGGYDGALRQIFHDDHLPVALPEDVGLFDGGLSRRKRGHRAGEERQQQRQ
jgi:ABC-type multidrug transport system fused ATPase/permease subunit